MQFSNLFVPENVKIHKCKQCNLTSHLCTRSARSVSGLFLTRRLTQVWQNNRLLCYSVQLWPPPASRLTCPGHRAHVLQLQPEAHLCAGLRASTTFRWPTLSMAPERLLLPHRHRDKPPWFYPCWKYKKKFQQHSCSNSPDCVASQFWQKRSGRRTFLRFTISQTWWGEWWHCYRYVCLFGNQIIGGPGCYERGYCAAGCGETDKECSGMERCTDSWFIYPTNTIFTPTVYKVKAVKTEEEFWIFTKQTCQKILYRV